MKRLAVVGFVTIIGISAVFIAASSLYEQSAQAELCLNAQPYSSAENPLELTFDEIAASRDDGSLHCEWVTVQGHFRWHEMNGYLGYLFPDIQDTAGEYSGYRLQLESFADPDERAWTIRATDIEVSGRILDPCRLSEAQIDTLVARPETNDYRTTPSCIGSGSRDLLLEQVHVLERHSDIDQVLSEASPTHRLVSVENAALTSPLIDVMRRWLSAIEQDEESYWAAQFEVGLAEFSIENANSQFKTLMQRAIANPNDWSSFLTGAETSPLNHMPDSEHRQFQVFRTEIPLVDDLYVGCVCMTEDCSTSWPIALNDTMRHSTDYLCLWLQHHPVLGPEPWTW